MIPLITRSQTRIDGIRVKYGDVYGEFHGGSGGTTQTCEWGAEDRIIIVQVKFENVQKQISLGSLDFK